MQRKKFFHGIAVWAVILSTVLWSIGFLAFAPIASAAPGEGTALLRIDGLVSNPGKEIIPGSFHEFEIELTVGGSGIAADGANIQVQIPTGFTPPQITSPTAAGFVEVSTNGTATLTPTVNGQNIDITVSGSALSPGDIVFIKYGFTNNGANESAKAQVVPGVTHSQATFVVNVDDTGGDTLTPLSDLSPLSFLVQIPLKISELQANGGGTAANEFVELYNSTNVDIDLSGWSITVAPANSSGSIQWDASKEVPITSGTIPAFGFFLVASNGYSPNGLTADVADSDNLDLDLSGYIGLKDPSGNIIDYVGYGTLTDSSLAEGGNPADSPGDNSLERKAFGDSTAQDMASGGIDESMGNGWDSNNNGLDFVVQSSPSPQNSSSPAEQPDFSNYEGGAANGPMIMHMPLNIAPSGSALEIIAQMGDPTTPINEITAELHYMVGDGSPADNTSGDYTTAIGTHQSNGYFKFTIPQSAVDSSTTNGLYYYLKVITSGGTAYMSADPAADGSGSEAQVAQHPFVVTIEDSTGWTKHSISGQIDDGSNPVAGALVFLEGTGYNTTTDASGNYILSNVKDGTYNIIITKDGYYDEWFFDVLLNGANITGKDKTLVPGTGGGMSGDTTKPFVTWSGPPDGMVGIPPGDENFKIFIGFSKDLDPSTVNNSNIYLTTDGTTPLSSAVVYDNDPSDNESLGYPADPYLVIVSVPSGGLAANTTYYLVLTTAVRDTAGNALQGNSPDGSHTISFTTGGNFGGTNNWDNFGVGPMIPPYVAGTVPYDGSTEAAPNTKINIIFSEPMDSSSVNSTNIKLYKVTYSSSGESLEAVSLASVNLDTSQTIATLTPASNLTAGKYRIVVSGALKSADGIWMGDPMQNQNTASYEFFRSHFEVLSTTPVDNIPPTVVGTYPADNATGVPVNPGVITIQFSEGLNPSSVTSNSVTLKRGSTKVNSVVSYDPVAQSVSVVPTVVLATDAEYTLTVNGDPTATSTSVTDLVGNPLASDAIITFTTASAPDTTSPEIMFANGDDYSIAVTFSEPMISAKVTDSDNWSKSVLNPANYQIKWGEESTVASSGTVIDLASVGAIIKYDELTNTAIIENLGLDPAAVNGKYYYLNMSPSVVSGSGATDLSGNTLANVVDFKMPIASSAETKGLLGPMTSGMVGGSVGPNMEEMGMMKAGAFPMNTMAGQTTTYFVDIPTSNAVEDGGKIVLTFPVGFDVSGAKKDTFSPVNDDINEWNDGTVAFSSAVENSGGAANDGVTVDSSTRTVTITLAVTGTPPAQDFLHLDIAGIINSSIPRDFDTSGYTVDIKILKADGSLSETVSGMPFFITAGGSSTLSGSITGIQAADVDGVGDEVKVYLGSPMTGPLETTASIASDGTGSYTFSNLPAGQYMIFTDPTITLDGHDYEGNPMPQPITITDGANTKDIALTKAGSGSVAAITVNITGSFGTDDIDVFAASPTGFKVKTLTSAGTNPSATLYLPDGEWKVGMGPAMPKGPMSSAPPMPDWVPPQPVEVVVSGNGTTVIESSGTANDGTIALTVPTANMQIIGYVQDDAGNAISDAEVFAYQPMGTGMGSFTKTDTNGKFTLKVSSAGTYSLGVHKPGLPQVSDRTVVVKADGDLEGVGGNPADDGNDTADIEVNKRLIVDVNGNGIEDDGDNLFVIRLSKPGNTISGKMTDGTNPVAYAPVWAYQQNGPGHAETMTDSSGNYILYVDNGTWIVQGNIPNYGDSQSYTIVVNGASVTQNILPDTSNSYYQISGTVTINGSPQTFLPIRAVKYDDNGNYTGEEYGSQTDSSGAYSISVPPGKYRVDIWTPDFGEVELTVADEVPNNPANVIITNASKSGKNITITSGALRTVTLAFTNGTANQTGIINIEGVSNGKPSGFHKTTNLSTLGSSSSVELPDGDYLFFLDVPGVGSYEPSTNPVTISGDTTVTFTLPDSSTELFTVSGQVTDSNGAVEGAWVWIGDETTGNRTGATTDNSGNYSLTVKAGTYKMGVEMPGYAPTAPSEITVSADTPNTNFTLNAASEFINGRIYADTNSNSSYDSGEEIANGWVWVEETTTHQIIGAPTDVEGVFSIPVIDGTYLLKGSADGYNESSYGTPLTVSGTTLSGKNIKLSPMSNWDPKLKSKPIAPASGGSLDDTGTNGSGIKVVAPPNALGSETSNGQLRVQEVTSVSRTTSASPLGGKGKQVTATDNSGQAITNLNDDVEINLVYYKDDIEEADVKDFTKLKKVTNSYWDASLGDWVPLPTTKTAYVKSSSNETEWTVVADYDSFVDNLNSNPDTYADYKIEAKSTVDHFTIFGLTTPTDSNPPTAPSGLSQVSGNGSSVVLDWDDNSESDLLEYEIYRSTSSGVSAIDANQVNTSQVTSSGFTDTSVSPWTSYYYTVTAVDDSGNESTVAAEIQVCSNSTVSNGTVAADCSITCNDGYVLSGHSCNPMGGGGGGSGSVVHFCEEVTYGEWGECVNGTQTREIVSRSPDSCSLTTAQLAGKTRTCLVLEEGSSSNPESGQTSEKETSQEEEVNQPAENKEKLSEEAAQKIAEFKEKILVIAEEAAEVVKANVNGLLGRLGIKRDLAKEKVAVKKYVKSLIKGAAGLPVQSQHAITNFIAYGTKTTRWLGEGERAGVINSYKSAFGKLPQTEAEWNDVIKIANGRWPSERDKQSETNAIAAFRKIYLREPDRNNPHDDAAVVIMAYGLRPSKRNLDSERAAIRIFKAIYGYNPKSASAWDVVRAIAYSGATR